MRAAYAAQAAHNHETAVAVHMDPCGYSLHLSKFSSLFVVWWVLVALEWDLHTDKRVHDLV